MSRGNAGRSFTLSPLVTSGALEPGPFISCSVGGLSFTAGEWEERARARREGRESGAWLATKREKKNTSNAAWQGTDVRGGPLPATFCQRNTAPCVGGMSDGARVVWIDSLVTSQPSAGVAAGRQNSKKKTTRRFSRPFPPSLCPL